MLGGGGSVNAMVYMRGQREDYDGWDNFLGGNSGWSYADMLPGRFRGMERNTKFNDAWHGINGRLWVSDPGYTCEMTEAFILAAQGAGIPYNPDFNGARQAGVGIMQHTIGRHARCDAVRAFLAPLRGDPRLTVVTNALVTRICSTASARSASNIAVAARPRLLIPQRRCWSPRARTIPQNC